MNTYAQNDEKQRVAELVDGLATLGFAVGRKPLMSVEDLNYLREFVDRIYEARIGEHDVSSSTPVVERLIGIDARVDRIFDSVLRDPTIRGVLEAIHGPDYKIWEISARYSIDGDPGLGIHQDAFGQMNLALNLSELDDDCGVTSFIPRSHMLYRWSHRVSWARPSIGNRIAVPLRFGHSDFAFFLNKTWHGRTRNKGGTVKKIILIGTFPAGAKYLPKFEEKEIESIDPACVELRRLVDFRVDTQRLESGEVSVVARDGTQGKPFSIELEDSKRYLFRSLPIFSKLAAMELIFRPARWANRVLKAPRLRPSAA